MRPLVVVLGISLVAAAAVGAQEAPRQESWSRVGIGIAFLASSPIGQLSGTSTAYISVPTGSTFRLEPTVGWQHSSFSDSSNIANAANGVSGSTSVFLVGVGFFGTTRPGNGATQLYYGPRIGLAWSSTNLADRSSDSLSASQTAWFVSAVLGGEHRIGHLSVGGEVGLSDLHISDPSYKQAGTGFTITLEGSSTLGTSAAAFVRWYF